MPEQVLIRGAVAFDPEAHGFAFPNAFVNEVLTLPNGAKITTAGRCGGMAYVSLDYFLAGQPAPRWRADLWAPSRVPPDSHWLARLFTQRLRDSFFTGSAAKFVTWSMHSDDETWVFKGVRRWTKEEELPRVIRSIDAGRPVVLGLVVARDLASVGHNHQVIAYGYEQDRESGRTTVQVYDNNSPGRAVTLTSEQGQSDWTASNGHVWRGFFVQDYTPRRPRVLTRNAPDVKDRVSTGDTVKLSHVWTGLTLHSHDRPYTHRGTDGHQQVTCFGGSDDNDRWLLVGTGGTAAGTALRDGSVVRLRHLSTGRWLHSAAGVPSPLSGQQEVSAVDTPDATADWRIEVVDERPWTAGARVRLVHVATDAALHSHRATDPRLTAGQQEVTAYPGRDVNDWWTVLELS
ncbi:MIR domain-containing protein [uncultured Cellulomonas sp.]|uniref:MIR domain-containing protein n=1 Tax=uncultured Cellulomonas sp. TaxID=189682 RepID=UPI0028E5BDF6|nr:MIR domain-containing protein [uncultured Cellulomonas sp.]